MMKARIAFAATLLVCGTAHAQSDDWGFSVGLKAWNASWSGFTYVEAPAGSLLTPVEAADKVVWIPSASLRWGPVVGVISGYTSANFRLGRDNVARRQETDFNLAWRLTPGLALSAGYKRLSQRAEYSYRPAGPVLGASASAPLSGTLAMYGNLGLGRLKTPGPSADGKEVVFDADYRLIEVGLSWALPVDRFVSALNLTLGYRMQVLVSKNAGRETQAGLDARDLTEGLALGVTMRF
jgi:hypothetical protein